MTRNMWWLAPLLAAVASLAIAQSRDPEAAPPSSVPAPVRADAPVSPSSGPDAVRIVTDPAGAREMALPKAEGADAEAGAAKLKGTVNDPDFRQALEAAQPLTPAQVRDIKEREEAMARALADRKPPSSSTLTIPVSMRPGLAPADILLSDDYVTALTLLDASGAPWPIAQAQAGNSQMFRVELPAKPGNVVVISPQMKYAASNLLLIAEGTHAPIIVSLRTTREVSYYSANLVVDERGPLATAPVSVPPPDPIDNAVMRAILDGVGALRPGVRQVGIRGAADTTAYYHGAKYYLRTPHALISPGYIGSISAGGIRVYEMRPAPAITVADASGRQIELSPDDETLLDSAIAAAHADR